MSSPPHPLSLSFSTFFLLLHGFTRGCNLSTKLLSCHLSSYGYSIFICAIDLCGVQSYFSSQLSCLYSISFGKQAVRFASQSDTATLFLQIQDLETPDTIDMYADLKNGAPYMLGFYGARVVVCAAKVRVSESLFLSPCYNVCVFYSNETYFHLVCTTNRQHLSACIFFYARRSSSALVCTFAVWPEFDNSSAIACSSM